MYIGSTVYAKYLYYMVVWLVVMSPLSCGVLQSESGVSDELKRKVVGYYEYLVSEHLVFNMLQLKLVK